MGDLENKNPEEKEENKGLPEENAKGGIPMRTYVIMALAGFNYLALVYQNFDSKECVQERRLMRRTPRETKRHYMKVWVAMDVCCEA